MVELSSQTIGLIFGVMVFCATMLATLLLLVFGGSFKRIREQAEIYSGGGSGALKKVLKPRPELYDELLAAARTLPKLPDPPGGGKDGKGDKDGAGELRGYHVTLRVFRESDVERLFEACNGSPTLGLAYDPELEIWNLTPHGPFSTIEDFSSSPLLQPLPDGLRFTVIDREKGCIMGMAAILANEPSCLRAEIGDIWLNPAYRDTPALQEVHYLLLGHLFGLGYRRVERRVDVGDAQARIDLQAAGFHIEGVLRKHMIVKGSNRDTAMFAMVNSDWRDKAKEALERIVEPEVPKKSRSALRIEVSAVLAASSSSDAGGSAGGSATEGAADQAERKKNA